MKKREVIAFQGELGAFSHQAAQQFLGEDIKLLPCERFEQVFQAVTDGRATGAALPIENTLHGSVHENYDHLLNFDLAITEELHLRIVHNLIAAQGVKFSNLKRVYSHPVALNQCLKFFADNPQIEKQTFYDTAGSVKMIMEQQYKDSAAIASKVAAETYNAKILKRSIEDDRENYTRFFLLRKSGYKQGKIDGNAKTSVVFTTKNSPGTLFRALGALALRDISVAKIESRPMRGRPWEYLFYLDFYGNTEEPRVKNALSHLGELADFLRVLGCYPAARPTKS